jgi:hypothetical protein
MSTDDSPNEAIRELWESLARGGPHWGADVLLTEEEEKFEAHLYLAHDLPPEVASNVQSYAKTFLELRGWKARTKLSRRYLLLALSRA